MGIQIDADAPCRQNLFGLVIGPHQPALQIEQQQGVVARCAEAAEGEIDQQVPLGQFVLGQLAFDTAGAGKGQRQAVVMQRLFQARLEALGAACPSVMFPYLRETVDQLLLKGGYPPLMLAPVNFEALYAERQRRSA